MDVATSRLRLEGEPDKPVAGTAFQIGRKLKQDVASQLVGHGASQLSTPSRFAAERPRDFVICSARAHSAIASRVFEACSAEERSAG